MLNKVRYHSKATLHDSFASQPEIARLFLWFNIQAGTRPQRYSAIMKALHAIMSEKQMNQSSEG